MEEIIMQILGLIALIFYNIFILLHFKKTFSLKTKHWATYILALAINFSVTILYYFFWENPFGIYFMMGSMIISFFLIFKGNYVQLLYAGSIYMFSLYSSRGIIMSIYSIVLDLNIKDIVKNHSYYDSIFSFSVFLSIIFYLFINKMILPQNKAKSLFNNKSQLKFVVIYLTLQLIFLTLINDGRYHDDINKSWLSSLYLGSCIISKIWLMFVFNHTSKVSELLEYELNTSKLQEQLYRQVRHYQSYKKFTESYRVFRHEHEKFITSAKILLRNQEYQKVSQLLDSIHDTMQNEVLIHKKYSDNVLLDAIFQDAANICEDKKIKYSVHVHIPPKVSIDNIKIINIFSNLVDNAIEACSKLLNQDCFIDIKSSSTNEWIVIEFSNSFDGKLAINNGIIESTKTDKDYHGFGLRIVRKTIEELGGLFFLEPDQINRIFKVRLCIPKSSLVQ